MRVAAVRELAEAWGDVDRAEAIVARAAALPKPTLASVTAAFVRGWWGRLQRVGEDEVEAAVQTAAKELVIEFGGDHLELANQLRRLVTSGDRPTDDDVAMAIACAPDGGGDVVEGGRAG